VLSGIASLPRNDVYNQHKYSVNLKSLAPIVVEIFTFFHCNDSEIISSFDCAQEDNKNFIFCRQYNWIMIQKEKDIRLLALYTNGPIHMASRCVYVPSDIYSRYRNAEGCFVCVRKRWTWCCHFDEKQKGLQEVIDKYDGIIRKSFIDFDISW
jgi:hypothetical protein